MKEWQLGPIVLAIQALRGVSLLTAAIIVAELGPLARFSKPKELMAYFGLAPLGGIKIIDCALFPIYFLVTISLL